MDRIEYLVKTFLRNGAAEKAVLTAVRAGWLAIYPHSPVADKLQEIILKLPERDCDDEGS